MNPQTLPSGRPDPGGVRDRQPQRDGGGHHVGRVRGLVPDPVRGHLGDRGQALHAVGGLNAAANLVGVRVEAETGGAAGQWGTSALFNSGLYKLKANTDYTVLGFTCSQPVVAVGLTGTDFGNLTLGGPGFFDQRWGGTYFVDLSERYGTAHVPVFNSNNAENINVAVADVATSTEVNVSFLCVQLNQLLATPSGGPGQ